LHYKQTRTGDAEIDRIMQAYLSAEQRDSQVSAFAPWGYDERQFGSPGFALPVGRLTRSAEEGYPEYHTSADNLELVSATALAAALSATRDIVEILESNHRYRNLAPHGEPQLGRRGIYRDTGGAASPELQRALLWVLSLSDGDHDMVEIYRRSALQYKTLLRAVELLTGSGLLEQID
jgi:aminopeptidase-like protein